MFTAIRTVHHVIAYGAVLVGPPTVLTVLTGRALPRRWPTGTQVAAWLADPLTPGSVTAALLTTAWLVWAGFAATAFTSAWTHLTRRARRWPAIRVPGPLGALHAAVLGATALTNVATATPAAASSPPVHSSLEPAAPAPAAGVPAASAGPAQVAGPGSPATVTVRRHDTLSRLADRHLGDADRWPDIYDRNKGRRFPVGGTLTDPNLIQPGWTLHLPTRHTHDSGTPPAPPAAPRPPATAPADPPPAPDCATPTPADPGAAPPGTDHPAEPRPGDPAPPPASQPSPTVSRPADDGVTEPTPAAPAAPAPAPPVDTPNSPAASTTAPTGPTRRPEHPDGIALPTGSWVDLGLAFAIAGAAAVVWRLRRRRYTPRPPSAQSRLDDPDLAPLPQVVTRVRAGLRGPAADEDTSLTDLLDTSEVTDTPDDAATEIPDGVYEQERTDPAPPLNLPALGNPMLAAWPPAGLGLTGPGAQAAARGFLASALASGALDDPHGRCGVVLPAATLATLLGAAAVNVPDTPRLTVTGDLTEALELLEEQTLHRTRLVYGHQVDTVAHLRDADPHEEPLPPILLLADATVPHERTRIAALLAQGQRLDIHGVLLGAWPDGNTVVVAGDGTTTPAEGEGSRHGSHPADAGRLAVITAAEAAALLPTLAESHTGLPQPPAPTEPQPRTPVATTQPATPTGDHDPPTAGPAPEPDAATPDQITGATQVPDTTPALTVLAETTRPNTAGSAVPRPNGEDGQALDDGDADDPAGDGPGVVAVQVLGPPTIVAADPQQPLRAKAMELLVYLIARDGGATVDAMKEDLVPDATVSKAPNRIHTYVYALRLALRRTGGRATYITHPRHRYLLNRDTLDVDLWRMRAALAAAETTTGHARLAALRDAVTAYRGPFAAGAHYEWAEPYREAVRRQALDAHLALADALRDQPEEALAVLDAAIAHDPYAEELYQAAMRHHADLDDIDAIAARLAELTRRLEELDTEPTDDTRELAGALTDDVRRRARRNRGGAA
ncbi:BTAD domain-containing putative transcriptional regulator [Solwaraspora sp. WMMD1047]|uniref:BTAD domain-containing putative transcriptional regulator n=1 Tax=Solwaraspora sp. WMMD1047 TaxID=3016102 RepID=UPI002416D6AF|nr:BTAD domain-containing putative transcriptional regulator [Solwaraspora sp. WMMD1047]MDG4834186.1 BTAD domain-containing putative transcriptional regulator [Solwaraspora sp. WMMD1047]